MDCTAAALTVASVTTLDCFATSVNSGAWLSKSFLKSPVVLSMMRFTSSSAWLKSNDINVTTPWRAAAANSAERCCSATTWWWCQIIHPPAPKRPSDRRITRPAATNFSPIRGSLRRRRRVGSASAGIVGIVDVHDLVGSDVVGGHVRFGGLGVGVVVGDGVIHGRHVEFGPLFDFGGLDDYGRHCGHLSGPSGCGAVRRTGGCGGGLRLPAQSEGARPGAGGSGDGLRFGGLGLGLLGERKGIGRDRTRRCHSARRRRRR